MACAFKQASGLEIWRHTKPIVVVIIIIIISSSIIIIIISNKIDKMMSENSLHDITSKQSLQFLAVDNPAQSLPNRQHWHSKSTNFKLAYPNFDGHAFAGSQYLKAIHNYVIWYNLVIFNKTMRINAEMRLLIQLFHFHYLYLKFWAERTRTLRNILY